MSARMDREFDVALVRFGAEIAEPGDAGVTGHRFELGGRTFFATRTRGGGRPPARSYEIGTPLHRADGSSTSGGPFRGSGRKVIEALRPVHIRREDGLTRAATRLGLARDNRTGDASFDEALFIESTSDAAIIEAFFADPIAREAVCTLLRAGAGRIVIGGAGSDSIVVEVAHELVPADVFAEGNFDALLQHAGRLADALPPVGRIDARISAGRLALIVALALLAIVGGASKALELNCWSRFGWIPTTELRAMGGAALVLVLAAWLAARKKPKAIGFFAVTALVGVCAGPLAVSGVVGLLNGALDAPRTVEALVDRQWKGDKGKPKVTIATDLGRAVFDVSRTAWNGLVPGTKVILEVGDGALGMPWYDPRTLTVVR